METIVHSKMLNVFLLSFIKKLLSLPIPSLLATSLALRMLNLGT
ncbi:hypothetical protein DET65_3710 [Sunxiuqinia elliptica]|uniref:Uncharacterized protein n=1 Tax=Sunxiuqinia elliptica TaxID=655355 RepID=A0A4R6GX06_9BACT|nr:hypothetical protein DET52_106146 [Sunxiuqinia elliptica]TDO57125.1 hypothetical protein DET65_3710 [Sunxiuqinia elliptica]